MQWTVVWWQWIRLGSRGLDWENAAAVSVQVLLSQVCDLGPSVGLGAPIWSLHASFIGLSEAIFQNWLHLRTWGRAHSAGVVNERGGSRGSVRSRGGWGCEGSLRRWGAPAGSRLHPRLALLAGRLWPWGLSSVCNDGSSSPYLSLSEDAARDSFFFLFSLPQAA